MLGKLAERGNINRQIRSAIGEGHARLQRRVGVDHGRCDRATAVPQGTLEAVQVGVLGLGLHKGFGRRAPQHHQAVAAIVPLEVRDVGHQLLSQVHLGYPGFHRGPVQPLDVVLVEHAAHWAKLLEVFLQRVDQRALEHAGVQGRFEGVVGKDVPGAKNEVVERGQRNEVLDHGRAVVGSLAEANSPHLGKRSDGLGHALLDGGNPGHERGRNRAQPNHQDAQAPAGGLDVHALLLSVLCHVSAPVKISAIQADNARHRHGRA